MTDQISLPGTYRGFSALVANGYRKDSCYVSVRDGCRLALDYYRPLLDGALPATPCPSVLISTGYRRSFLLKEGEFFAENYRNFEIGDCVSFLTVGARLVDRHVAKWHRPVDGLTQDEFRDFLLGEASSLEFLMMHGFNVVILDNRATGASFGASDGLDHQTQGQDAGDIIRWIATQPWSTDRIGMLGSSWLGLAQNATISCSPPPELKAVMPFNAGEDTFTPMYPGGVYNVGLMRQWYAQRDMFERGFEADVVDEDPDGTLRAAAVAERGLPSDDPPWILTIPTADEREALLDYYGAWSRDRYQKNSRYYGRTLPDGSFGDWKMGHLDPTLANRSDVAYYGYGGFWDLCGYTMAMAYADLTVPRKLLIGPWNHGNWKRSEQQESLRWLDHHLRQVDNGIMREPPVTYAVSHPSEDLRWYGADTFPPRRAQRWLLNGVPQSGLRGSLSENGAEGSFELPVDYDVSTGIANRNWGYYAKPQINLDLLEESRDKVVTLLSEPMAAEREIVGFPIVSLHLSTTADSGAVFVYLQDIAPDGTAYYVSEGQLNLRDRKVSQPPFDYLGVPYHSVLEADRLPVVPGEVMALEIGLFASAWRVPKGHRLCLTISGADKDNGYQKRRDPAPVLTIYCTAQHPLTLSLPIVDDTTRDATLLTGAFADIRPEGKVAATPTATALVLA